jgi:hypothetical protein
VCVTSALQVSEGRSGRQALCLREGYGAVRRAHKGTLERPLE